MASINDLLKDNVINKAQLFKKRKSYLGIDENLSNFILKVFQKHNSCSNLNIEQLSETFSTNIETTKMIMKNIISSGYVQVENNENNEMIFNFETIVEKLLNSYVDNLEKESTEFKLNWVSNELDFELTKNHINEIKKLIENNHWSTVYKIVNIMCEYDEQNWVLFQTLYNSLDSSKKIDKEVKEILDTNWLLE